MAKYDRIEPETEAHRLEKAVASLVKGRGLPLAHGAVRIDVATDVLDTPCGQHLLLMVFHLLARMKGIARTIVLPLSVDPPIVPGVPLSGRTFSAGLRSLIASCSGPLSLYRTELVTQPRSCPTDVRIGIGTTDADVLVGADAWRALLGSFAQRSRWGDQCPLGPYFAATVAAAEVFKRLLRLNFGWHDGTLTSDLAYSLFDYSFGDAAAAGQDIAALAIHDLAVAGIGAGGTAALYTIASFPEVTGIITGVDPGRLKESNLGRYLMTDYARVHEHSHKLDSAHRFLEIHAPKLQFEPIDAEWRAVNRPWKSVICTVDTPEARWDVQRSGPTMILEGGVLGLLFGVLRVVPEGWCLECKHPPDANRMWRRRALRWGLSVEEVVRRYNERIPVTATDVERLADVQGRPKAEFEPLVGVPFDQVPALTECGESPLALSVPSQAPVLPIATTATGIVLAAEAVKDLTGLGTPLHNYVVHDLRFRVRPDGQKFKQRLLSCSSRSHTSGTMRNVSDFRA